MRKKIGMVIFCCLMVIFASGNPGTSQTDNTIGWTQTSDPDSFSWTPAESSSGAEIAGYKVYWGKDKNGQDDYNWVSSTSYDPPLCDHNLDGDADDLEDTGEWYLRIQAVDQLGNKGDWHTVLTYQYDNVAPDLSKIPVKIVEITEQNQLPSQITWQPADDGEGIGVGRYRVYWGNNPNGTYTEYAYSCQYNPEFTNYGTYYLRIQAIDKSYNESEWQTVYMCNYLEPLPIVQKSPEIKKIFTGNDSYKIPQGEGNPSKVVLTDIIAVGGGGGGAAGNEGQGGGGGAGAEIKSLSELEIVANTKINITVGAGGLGGQTADGSNGGLSKITKTNGNILEAAGGQAGKQDGTGGQQYVIGGNGAVAGEIGRNGMKADQDSALPGGNGGSIGDSGSGGGGGGGYIAENIFANNGSGESAGIGGQGYGAGGGGGAANSNSGGQGASGYVAFTVKYLYESEVNTITKIGESNWTNQAQPAIITWQRPSKKKYDIKGYNVYWGTSEQGTGNKFQRSTFFAPPKCTQAGIHYLRVQTVDIHDNKSAWQTVYVYRFDNEAPGKSSTSSTTPWNNSPDNNGQPLTWEAANDSLSGIKGYQVYFGQNPQGTATSFVSCDECRQIINCTASTQNYYLRIRAVDNAGNYGQWQTVHTYQFDNVPPKAVTDKTISEWTTNYNPGEVNWKPIIDYGASGTAGYHVYWGTDPQGTTTTKITDNKYSPSNCSASAIYYLRVQVVDRAGNTSAWQDVLTYRYDNKSPEKSLTNETEGWTNEADRKVFTWDIPTDNGGSGVAKYQIYWGTDQDSQQSNQPDTRYNRFDPPIITGSSKITYYLKIKAIDNVGNQGQWQTVLTYKYDNQAPSEVTTFYESPWTKEKQYRNLKGNATYTWNIPKTASGGNVSQYKVYWGTDPQGTSTALLDTNSYLVPPCTESKIYYLRVQSLDNSLEGPWKTVLIYKYDNQAPKPTTTQEKTIKWVNVHNNLEIKWNQVIDDGAGFKGYFVYWGPTANSDQANKGIINNDYYILPRKLDSSGTYYLRIKPFDKIDNQGQWQTILTYQYDQDNPSFNEVISNGESPVTAEPQAALQQWTAAKDVHSGIAGYEVYWGTEPTGSTGKFQEGTSYIPPACTQSGKYYLRVRAKDNAGNFSMWQHIYTYDYDFSAPIHLQKPLVSNWTQEAQPEKITWTAAEDQGLAGFSHYLIYWGEDIQGESNEKTVQNEYTPVACTQNGIYYLRVQAVDTVGNASAWQTYYTYKYDRQAPIINLDTITIDWTSQKDPDVISWMAADESNGSGLKGYYVYWGQDPQGVQEDTLQVDNSFDPPACEVNATFYLRVKAVDQLDNASEWQTVLVYQYDDLVPEQSVTNVIKDWTNQDNPNTEAGYFQWELSTDNCAGISHYYYYWGQDPQGISFESTKINQLQLPLCKNAGTYYLRIMPVDLAGNYGQWQTIYQYKFDNAAPEQLPKLIVNDWTKVADCPLYQWNVTDNHSGVRGNYIYWGTDPQGESEESLIEKFEYDPPICTESGHYYLRIKAVDKFGNVGQWHTIFIYRYDNIAPQATETNITTEWTNNPQPNKVSWLPASDTDGSGVAGYNLYWGTDPSGDKSTAKVNDCQYLPPKCVTSSIHYLRVQTVDTAGNTSNWQTVLTYRYDNKPPGNNIETQTVSWTNDKKLVFKGTDWQDEGGSGVKNYEMLLKKPSGQFLNVGASDKPECEINDLDQAGEYLLYIRAVDQVGNRFNWEDLMRKAAMVYEYDGIAPGDTNSRATSDWTIESNCPEITWDMPIDNISGIAGHYVYWGKEPEGEDLTVFVAGNEYDPPACEQQGIHYLRVLSKDGAGNTGQWRTVYTYRFASEPPGEIPAIVSDWTNQADCPQFTWQVPEDLGGSGIRGYDVYWGVDEDGTNEAAFQTENSYDPPACQSNKIHYLRIRAYDQAGHIGKWQTVYTYRYETISPGSSPSKPATGKWTNDAQSKVVKWQSAMDFGEAGIGGYQIYWGMEENGEQIISQVTDCQYQPQVCTDSGKYYLRIRPVDKAGNLGAWQMIMIYQYDNIIPERITSEVVSDWTNQMDCGLITWDEPTDQGGSGIAGYNFYWGTDSEGISEEKIAVNKYNPPKCEQAVTHYLRVRPYDQAGNNGQWQTVYTYQLSTQIPEGSQTTATQEGWTNVADRVAFSWEAVNNSASGIAGYRVYWGTNEQGISDNILPGNTFDPPQCSQTGTYYLRIQPVDNASNEGSWQTVLIYKYTDQKPGASSTYLEKPWTNQKNVGKVTWNVAEDLGNYGIAGYLIYWGQAPQGTKDEFITTANYMPAACDQQGVYYLRICPVNKPGNSGQWQTVLQYSYEHTKPEFVVDTAFDQPWTNVAQASKVDWIAATDSGGSDLKGYNIYWGTKPSQANAEFFTQTNSWLPLACTLDAQYHLLVQAIDQAGNTSEWQTVLTYQYDGQAPPLSGTEEIAPWTKIADCPQFSWQQVVDNSGSGFKGYQVRWVTDKLSPAAGAFTAVNSFDPPACTQSGIYYLQVKSLDNVGNASDWQSVLTYRYDQDIPEMIMVKPLSEGGIAKNQSFIFKLLDNLSGINQDSLTVKINQVLIDNPTIQEIDGGYLVTVKAAAEFSNNQTVELAIEVSDDLGNILTKTLTFQVAEDKTAPIIKNTTPTFNATNTKLSFEIIEADSEIDKKTIFIVINSAVYNLSSHLVKCTPISNGYLLTVDAGAFAGQSVVSIMVHAKNTSGYAGVCNVEYKSGNAPAQPAPPQENSDVNRSNGGTGEQIYSYPNPFNAAKHSELTIVFEAKKQESLEILVYNIKGQIIWRTTAEAEEGRNIIKWDGQDAFGKKLSNGIYFLFVVNSEKKVVYKGRMCAVD